AERMNGRLAAPRALRAPATAAARQSSSRREIMGWIQGLQLAIKSDRLQPSQPPPSKPGRERDGAARGSIEETRRTGSMRESHPGIAAPAPGRGSGLQPEDRPERLPVRRAR